MTAQKPERISPNITLAVLALGSLSYAVLSGAVIPHPLTTIRDVLSDTFHSRAEASVLRYVVVGCACHQISTMRRPISTYSVPRSSGAPANDGSGGDGRPGGRDPLHPRSQQ